MFTKILQPCTCEVYANSGNLNYRRAYVKVEFTDDGKLSIRGVVGPTQGGNCYCGVQCYDEILSGRPAEGWTKEMIEELCNVWKRWHLNDMRPYCEHQKAAGWNVLAQEDITLYHYKMTPESLRHKKEAEDAALAALRKGEAFTPTPEQLEYAALSYSYNTYDELPNDGAPYYEPRKPLYPGDKGARETKKRGWVRFDECEMGILCKPCPVCGYKYGSKWLKEEVPEEVLNFLKSLPDSPTKPAWI